MKSHFPWRIITLSLLAFAAVGASAQTWLTAGPYLQEITADGATVMFEHGYPSLSWVEVREKGQTESRNFFETVNGQIKVQRQIIAPTRSAPTQNFAVRATGLKPNTTYEYRIHAKRVTNYNANGVTLYASASKAYASGWYSFTTLDPYAKEHHIFLTSDMHNRPDTLKALLQYLDYATCDHFILNGDMTNFMNLVGSKEEPYAGYVNMCVSMFATGKDFYVTRGNHENRGDISRHFLDYFPTQSHRAYNLYRWGDLAVVMLDCGEDKVDNHKEYFGLVSSYNYREREAEWLKQAVETPEFKTAKWRLLVGHFPMFYGGTRNNEFDGMPHYSELLVPIVVKAGFDFALSGHGHPTTYVNYPVNYKSQGNQFEEYMVGYYSGVRIDIQDGKMNFKIVSTTGKTLVDRTITQKSERKLVYITLPE